MVERLAFSFDDMYIAASTQASTIHVWNVETGVPIATRSVQHESSGVCEFAFQSPTSATTPTSSTIIFYDLLDKSVRAWDFLTGWEQVLCKCESAVCALSISSDGSLLATAASNQISIMHMDRLNDEVIHLVGHKKPVSEMTFSKSGVYLASASSDNMVQVWKKHQVQNKQKKEVRAHWKLEKRFTHSGVFASLSWNKSSSKLASLWDEDCIVIRNTTTWEEEVKIFTNEPVVSVRFGMPYSAVAAQEVDEVILSGGVDCELKVWNARTGDRLAQFSADSLGLFSASYSPQGQYIAAGGAATVMVWKGCLDSLMLSAPLPAETKANVESSLNCLALSWDGLHLAAGSDDSAVYVWSASTPCGMFDLKHTLLGHTSCVRNVCFHSSDQRYVVSQAGEAQVRVWDLHLGTCLWEMAACTAMFHPTENTLIALTVDTHVMKLFSTVNGQCMGTWGEYSIPKKRHKGDSYTCQFSPDGCFFAAVNGETISIFHAKMASVGEDSREEDNTIVLPAVTYRGSSSVSFSAASDMLVYLKRRRIWTATRWGTVWSPTPMQISTAEGHKWKHVEFTGDHTLKDHRKRRLVACTEFSTVCAVLYLPSYTEKTEHVEASVTILLDVGISPSVVCFSRTTDVFFAAGIGMGTIYVWETVAKNESENGRVEGPALVE
jgi:WD40 repeat protein